MVFVIEKWENMFFQERQREYCKELINHYQGGLTDEDGVWTAGFWHWDGNHVPVISIIEATMATSGQQEHT